MELRCAPSIPSPEPPPPRREPELALPPYRYVPGRLPHPREHPAGHGHRLRPDEVGAPPAPGRKPMPDRRFRHGCDLFDHRYVWEAHELWEELWKEAPVGTPERELLQGLILAAAWLLKRHMGEAASAARLRTRALARLAVAEAALGRRPWGVDLDGLRADDPSGWPRLG